MHPKKIESIRNPALKTLLNPRLSLPYFAIEGPNLLEAAIESGRATLGAVFVTGRGLANHAELIARATGYGNATGLYEVPDHIMERVSDTLSPQGIVALCKMKPYSVTELDLTGRPLVVLDALQDPGNVGSIIRTAQAAGSGGVLILPGTADPFSPKALRASAGGALRMPVVMAGVEALRALYDQGVRVIHAVPAGGTSIYQADLTPPLAIVFGNEAHGISDLVREIPATQISLPVLGGAESLNVAASVAVFLYEALRRTLPRPSP